MALDTNIALGVKPIEQPNMLAQMGQMMQMRQAQQQYDQQNALRDAFAQGADITDPATFKRIAQQDPTLAYKLKGQHLEQTQKGVETGIKINEALGGGLEWLSKNPSLDNAKNLFGDLVNKGVLPPDKAQAMFAKLQAEPDKISYYANLGYQSAITAQAKMQDATSRANNAATVGASMYGHNVSKDNSIRTDTRERGKLHFLTGDNGFYGVNQYSGTAIPVGMAPPPPQAQPPVTNALANPATANTVIASPVNSLLPTAPSQVGAPTVANAEALAAQQNIIKPSKPIRQPVAVIKDGVVTLVPPDQAVGMTPATPGAEKALEKVTVAKEGKQAVNGVLNTLYSEYNNLVKSGGITDTRKSAEDNIAARTGASGIGQLTGSYTGSESQSFRDTIEQTRPLLLTAIMKATGLSATQLNSNVELQTYLKTATDPKVSIQSNVKALNNISSMFGIGEKFEVPAVGGSTPKEVKPSGAPPAGLSPEIAKLWQYMTPEDRKLWQK
jgi:hypothetical protein